MLFLCDSSSSSLVFFSSSCSVPIPSFFLIFFLRHFCAEHPNKTLNRSWSSLKVFRATFWSSSVMSSALAWQKCCFLAFSSLLLPCSRKVGYFLISSWDVMGMVGMSVLGCHMDLLFDRLWMFLDENLFCSIFWVLKILCCNFVLFFFFFYWFFSSGFLFCLFVFPFFNTLFFLLVIEIINEFCREINEKKSWTELFFDRV